MNSSHLEADNDSDKVIAQQQKKSSSSSPPLPVKSAQISKQTTAKGQADEAKQQDGCRLDCRTDSISQVLVTPAVCNKCDDTFSKHNMAKSPRINGSLNSSQQLQPTQQPHVPQQPQVKLPSPQPASKSSGNLSNNSKTSSRHQQAAPSSVVISSPKNTSRADKQNAVKTSSVSSDHSDKSEKHIHGPRTIVR